MTFFTETSLSACTCVGIRWPRNFFLMVMTCHLTAPAMPIMRDDELCNLSYSCFFFLIIGCPTKATKKRPPTTGTQFKVSIG